jgi:hypothetical protein
MTVPDFIIIGAMKAGTTTLHEQLARQSGFFMTTPKEPNFFSDDAQYAKGTDWYASLFDAASPRDFKGEGSTHYTKQPTYPKTVARLKSNVPNLKLIYMIRNPLERVISHYLHGWSQTEISVPFEQALSDHPELVDYGRYGMQIAPFIKAFGTDAVHLTSLEQYKSDPNKVLADIGQFLGIEAELKVMADVDPKNVTADRYRKLPFSVLLVENVVARSLRRLLVPKALREKIRGARTRKDRPMFKDADHARLEAIFLEDRTTLAALFPTHPALRLCYPFAP